MSNLDKLLPDTESPVTQYQNNLNEIYSCDKTAIIDVLAPKLDDQDVNGTKIQLNTLPTLRDELCETLREKFPLFDTQELNGRRVVSTMALDVYLLGLSIANNHPDERLNTVFKRSKHSGTGCQDDVTTSPDTPILCAADLTETCLMLHKSVISLTTSIVTDLQQEVKELRSKLASYPEPGLNDNPTTSDKQNQNNKLLQPSSNILDSDAEVIAENDFRLSKSQQRKLMKGSQTIPNSFPGITGESASGHSFCAASTIPLLRLVFIGNAHPETTEDAIRKHVTNIGLANGLSDVQPLPSTIAGRAAFCVTFNDHTTEEKTYKCDWPNRVIVRPYRPPRKNIHETVSNGRYNHRGHQGNGNTMDLPRGCNAMQNNNKRYNNKRYNNNITTTNITTTTATAAATTTTAAAEAAAAATAATTTTTTTHHTVTTITTAATTADNTIITTITITITTSVITTTSTIDLFLVSS